MKNFWPKEGMWSLTWAIGQAHAYLDIFLLWENSYSKAPTPKYTLIVWSTAVLFTPHCKSLSKLFQMCIWWPKSCLPTTRFWGISPSSSLSTPQEKTTILLTSILLLSNTPACIQCTLQFSELQLLIFLIKWASSRIITKVSSLPNSLQANWRRMKKESQSLLWGRE